MLQVGSSPITCEPVGVPLLDMHACILSFTCEPSVFRSLTTPSHQPTPSQLYSSRRPTNASPAAYGEGRREEGGFPPMGKEEGGGWFHT